MTQSCSLWAIWMTWLGIPLLAVVAGMRWQWWAGVLVLAVGVAAQWLYVRSFPRISRWVGYGSVADVPAEHLGGTDPLQRVVFYTGNVCPFCPIVRRRLLGLQQRLHFDLEEIDVTFRPDIIRAKGLRSVPVVEVGGRTLAGNATSEQLAALIQAPNRTE